MRPLPSKQTVAVVALTVLLVGMSIPIPVGASAGQQQVAPFEAAERDTNGVLPEFSFGVVARVSYYVDKAIGGLGPEHPTVQEQATDVSQYVNERSDTFVAYTNDCAPSSANLTQYDTVGVIFERDGDRAVRYVEADVAGGDAESLAVVNQTNRTVDFNVTFSEFAPGLVDDDIEHIYQEYAEPGACPDRMLKARLTARYGGGFAVSSGGA